MTSSGKITDKLRLIILLLLWQNIISAQKTSPAERTVKLFHYDAILSFNPHTLLLKGVVTYDLSPLRSSIDSFALYSPGIDIKQVSMTVYGSDVREKHLVYRKVQDNLIIYPGRVMEKKPGNEPLYAVIIQYTAIAPKELHLTGWDDPTGRMRKQVWAHRPFGWIPFMDQMCTQDLTVTFDKNYQLVCNGERLSKTSSGDTAFTWHYRLDKPHPFYSVCMVAGEYQYKVMKSHNGLPLELWYYPEQADRVDKTYEFQNEMFDFFEDETGFLYPYKLYRNVPVADYLYGAMETTTSTVFADFMVVDKGASFGRTFLNTNAHELAHQWFGNCINDKTSDDLWLTESFATYFAKIFEKKYQGEEAYENQRDIEFQKALKIAETNNFPLGSGKAGTERWYQKGSLVMDMMRDVLGDEAFKAAIKEYLDKNAYSEAESNDLLKAIYNSSGVAMDWFFKEWIYQGGEPEYKVKWQDGRGVEGSKGRKVEIIVEQVQQVEKTEDYFKMPVGIDVYYEDGSFTSRKVWVEKQISLIDIDVDTTKKLSFVVFDAGRRILKKLQFDRSVEELSSQLLHARYIPDRLEALRSLQKTPLDQKRKALKASFQAEKSYLIKEEIIAQLGSDSLSYDIVRLGIKDGNARVRKAVTDNFKIVPADLLKDYEALLHDSSYFIIEAALVNLSNSAREKHAADIDRYLNETKDVKGWRGNNVRTAWLGVALLRSAVLDSSFLNELIDYTGISFDFETRLNAFNQLKKLNYLDARTAHELRRASNYWNYKLASPAKEMITYFSQNERYRWLLDSISPK